MVDPGVRLKRVPGERSADDACKHRVRVATSRLHRSDAAAGGAAKAERDRAGFGCARGVLPNEPIVLRSMAGSTSGRSQRQPAAATRWMVEHINAIRTMPACGEQPSGGSGGAPRHLEATSCFVMRLG